MKVELDIYDDLGGERQIGFLRPDFEPSRVVHTIVRAPGGAAFTVDGHFETCEVCKRYGVTQDMFHAFMLGRLQ